MEGFIDSLNSIIWSKGLIYLCLGAGLIYSIQTRFAQVRHFKEMLRLLFKRKSTDSGISSFQALAVSLSGRVGVGNIAGVAAAIGFGWPRCRLLDVGRRFPRREHGVCRVHPRPAV